MRRRVQVLAPVQPGTFFSGTGAAGLVLRSLWPLGCLIKRQQWAVQPCEPVEVRPEHPCPPNATGGGEEAGPECHGHGHAPDRGRGGWPDDLHLKHPGWALLGLAGAGGKVVAAMRRMVGQSQRAWGHLGWLATMHGDSSACAQRRVGARSARYQRRVLSAVPAWAVLLQEAARSWGCSMCQRDGLSRPRFPPVLPTMLLARCWHCPSCSCELLPCVEDLGGRCPSSRCSSSTPQQAAVRQSAQMMRPAATLRWVCNCCWPEGPLHLPPPCTAIGSSPTRHASSAFSRLPAEQS